MLLQMLFVLLMLSTFGASCRNFVAARRSERHDGRVHELARQTIWFQFCSGVTNISLSQLVQNFVDRCNFTSDNNFSIAFIGTTSLCKTFLSQSLWKWISCYTIFYLYYKKVKYFDILCLLCCRQKVYACKCFSFYAKQAVRSQFQIAKQFLLHKKKSNRATEDSRDSQLKIVGCFGGLNKEGTTCLNYFSLRR
jgi:hypothetical protein